MFLFDTHVHTEESSTCGEIPAKGMVEYYRLNRYDGIVITDHFKPFGEDKRYGQCDWKGRVDGQWLGYEIAKQYETEDFTVLHGVEIRFKGHDNDYLVFGADKQFFYDHPEITETSLENFRKVINEHEGIMIFHAHPFRNNMTVVNPYLVDGIEIYNGNASHNSRNSVAYEWARLHGLKMISGSDCHEPFRSTPGGVYFEERPTDEKQLVEMLKAGSYTLKTPGGIIK